MSQTSRIIGPILDFFFPNMPEPDRLVVHYYVRKTAHFTEYAVLAFMTMRALVNAGYRMKRLWLSAAGVGLALLIACIDEFNQAFEPSRTGSPWDVALDVSGAVFMVIFLWLADRPRSPSFASDEDQNF